MVHLAGHDCTLIGKGRRNMKFAHSAIMDAPGTAPGFEATHHLADHNGRASL